VDIDGVFYDAIVVAVQPALRNRERKAYAMVKGPWFRVRCRARHDFDRPFFVLTLLYSFATLQTILDEDQLRTAQWYYLTDACVHRPVPAAFPRPIMEECSPHVGKGKSDATLPADDCDSDADGDGDADGDSDGDGPEDDDVPDSDDEHGNGDVPRGGAGSASASATAAADDSDDDHGNGDMPRGGATSSAPAWARPATPPRWTA